MNQEPKSAAQDQPASTSSSSERGSPAPAVQFRTLGMAFTAKQQAAWDLTRPVAEGGQGKTRSEAAAILGISAPVVSKTIQACYRKRGITHAKGKPSVQRSAEFKNPELAAGAIDAAGEPAAIGKIRDAIREAGLPLATTEALIKRLRVKYYGAITAVRNLKTQEILDLMGQKIHLALQYMDDKTMSEASFRDLALGTTAMIEKRQLLRGEPTQIISDAERAKLHELVPLLIQEAQRRGLTVDGQVTGKIIEPA